jgi:hypothetical protein
MLCATTALLIFLLTAVSARNPITGIDHFSGPTQPINNQCAPVCAPGDSRCQGRNRICPVQLGDFHFICGEFDYLDAAEACNKMGWRLAVLNETNRIDGYNNMAQCLLLGGQAAWISNYLGMDEDPCAVLLLSGGVIFGLGQQACSKRRLGALCQDLQLRLSTATTTITTVVRTGVVTTTTTTTTCKHQHHRHCHECMHKDALDLEGKAEKEEEEDFGDRCRHGSCAPVCPFRLGDIRVIQTNVTPFDAAEECERYGWTLLDLTVGRMNEFAEVARACSFGDNNLWINSFNGVALPCLNSFSARFSNVVPVGYPVLDEWCTLDNMFYVACQRGCQAETGNGPYSGLIGRSITTTTSSVVFTIPSATVTVTKTVIRKVSSSSSSSSSCSDSSDPTCSGSKDGRRRHRGPRRL